MLHCCRRLPFHLFLAVLVSADFTPVRRVFTIFSISSMVWPSSYSCECAHSMQWKSMRIVYFLVRWIVASDPEWRRGWHRALDAMLLLNLIYSIQTYTPTIRKPTWQIKMLIHLKKPDCTVSKDSRENETIIEYIASFCRWISLLIFIMWMQAAGKNRCADKRINAGEKWMSICNFHSFAIFSKSFSIFVANWIESATIPAAVMQ